LQSLRCVFRPRAKSQRSNAFIILQIYASFPFFINFRVAWNKSRYGFVPYKGQNNMTPDLPDSEWKKGSAELLVLSLLEDQPRHGYDISKLIELRSGGALRFHVTSLYPLLHRLEEQGSIVGRWVEKAEQRRRRYYSLTEQGKHVLRSKQASWKEFVAVISRVTGIEHA
jgi:PadR family transcriptional regulator PadR